MCLIQPESSTYYMYSSVSFSLLTESENPLNPARIRLTVKIFWVHDKAGESEFW